MDFSNIESGLVFTAIGYTVVFIALLLLYIVFKILGNIASGKWKQGSQTASTANEYAEDLTGETNAAIGLALHLHFHEKHDEESRALTISRISKRYSPWSSKIYGVLNGLNRNF